VTLLSTKKTFLRTLKRTYVRFLKLRGNPREIALGFALGVFIGLMPFLGFQIALAVVFAAFFKWNKISAVMATWISNPLTYPFIYSFTYLVGSTFIGTEKPFGLPDDSGLSFMSRMLHKAPEIFISLSVGGVIVGLPAAVISYYLTYLIIHRYQERIKTKAARRKKKLMNLRKKEKNTNRSSPLKRDSLTRLKKSLNTEK
jgi:uncharacterized protein (DUF2062 family)